MAVCVPGGINLEPLRVGRVEGRAVALAISHVRGDRAHVVRGPLK